jgi:protein FAM160A1
MSLSAVNDSIGHYIAECTSFCPVLATGLSGLYSSLPRKLKSIISETLDWYHDIQKSPEIQNFLTSLEFCNAVVQVSHSLVRKQLCEYVYQGFLVLVIGPALHQVCSTFAYFKYSIVFTFTLIHQTFIKLAANLCTSFLFHLSLSLPSHSIYYFSPIYTFFRTL